MVYVLLLIGFVLLIKGADIFVDGSVSIAEHFHIPSLIIGLTIIAFGTSAPEAAVSITAAISGQNGIAVGNVIGSNIFNLLVVLGICALIKPCPIDGPTLKGEYPLSIFAALAFVVLALTAFPGEPGLHLCRFDGIILLVIFTFFLFKTIRKSLASQIPEESSPKGETSLSKAIFLSIIGLVGVIAGGQLVVSNASSIASSFGLSQTLIGLTIVSIGTSLPELVTSAVAATKGHTDIAIGNVIGSNLFNILFVLGISVTIHPIQTEMISVYDGIILIVASILVMIPFIIKKEIRRPWGFLFIAFYAVYMVYIIMR
ncbi:MAG: calcium/sodium antiporter [Anaerovoracaceae bacterium]